MAALACARHPGAPGRAFPDMLRDVLCRDHTNTLALAAAAARTLGGRGYAEHVRHSAAIRQQLREGGHGDEAQRLERVARAHLAPLAFQNGPAA